MNEQVAGRNRKEETRDMNEHGSVSWSETEETGGDREKAHTGKNKT